MAQGKSPEVSKGSYKRIFSVLFQITKVVNSGAPLQTLLEAVAGSSVDLVGADSCSIMLLDESRRELLINAASGLSPEESDALTFKVGEGVAGWVAEHGAPALIPDTAADPRFKVVAGQKLAISSLLCVPLLTKDGVIGTLTVTSARARMFGKDHEELLMYLGASIVKDIENARLYRLSITDSLTKAYNRQYLYQRLPDEIERCRRYGDQLSVVLFDVDHFKQFNDTYGHAAGDFVLKEIVRVALATMRDVDGLVRYGGEEFLMLLPKTAIEGATEAAERMRVAIEHADFLWSDQRLKVTLSAGVVSLWPGASDDAVLKRVDELLYQAKSGGRNRVAVG
ncbi:MAG: GGDEF domain-containing protein [Myxococcaceae bacterium]